MRKKILGSLIFSVIALAAVVVVNFFLPRIMPGDPVYTLIGGEDDYVTQEEYDYYYQLLGLNKPVSEQFGDYLRGLFTGDLGYSYHQGGDVADVIAEKIPVTLQVALPAMIISALVAMLWGLRAGSSKSRMLDRFSTGFNIALNSVPTFFMAMLAVIIFAYELQWLPYGGLNSVIPPDDPFLYFLDRLTHLVLPVGTLVAVSTPAKYVLVRNMAAKEQEAKYAVFAQAKGLSGARVRIVHVFSNICQPFIALVGTGFGKMLSGSLVVEMIFSLDGMGTLVGNAVTVRDYPTLQGCLFVIAVMVIVANFATDVLCALSDPRQRLGEAYE